MSNLETILRQIEHGIKDSKKNNHNNLMMAFNTNETGLIHQVIIELHKKGFKCKTEKDDVFENFLVIKW
jgi:hypothetical protein